MNSSLKRGVFVLSLDTELAWGSAHEGSLTQREAIFQQTRHCISRLLVLMEKYQIHATWALIGHLFLDHCQPVNGIKHPEIIRPQYTWYPDDWFLSDPCSSLGDAPIWYGRDIVQQIQNCKVNQEIGCHTFSHVQVGKPGCSRECFASELHACRVEAEKFGLNLQSFVFPHNSIGYLDVLADAGFIAYRGVAPTLFERLPGITKRICQQLGRVFPFTPPVLLPRRENGLWNLPASYFFPSNYRWWQPAFGITRVYKVKRGLRKAVKKQSAFHLWFHPFNLAIQPDKLLSELEVIFAEICRYRDAGQMDNLTMGELAHSLSAPLTTGGT
jgi:hypothetical protein